MYGICCFFCVALEDVAFLQVSIFLKNFNRLSKKCTNRQAFVPAYFARIFSFYHTFYGLRKFQYGNF